MLAPAAADFGKELSKLAREEVTISFSDTLQHTPGSEIIKRLAEHARRLARRWEQGGDRRTRFESLIKTKSYHANIESFVRPGMKMGI